MILKETNLKTMITHNFHTMIAYNSGMYIFYFYPPPQGEGNMGLGGREYGFRGKNMAGQNFFSHFIRMIEKSFWKIVWKKINHIFFPKKKSNSAV